jgi:hypothetical protein
LKRYRNDLHLEDNDIGLLYILALNGYRNLVKAVLKERADINAQGGQFGNALQAALYEGRYKIVTLLLKGR